MRSTDFPFAVMPQRLQRGGRPDYSAPSAALAAVRAGDDQQFGGISARDTSVRDQIKDKLAVIVGRRNADKLLGVGELLGADAPLMLDEAQLAYREGRPGEAAATAALAVLPIPGAAKKGIKAAAKKVAASTKPAAKATTRTFSETSLNPDVYGLRKTKDFPRLQTSPVKVERFSVAPKAEKVSLADYEGRPFIISMADRSAAGDRITGIGNTDLNLPVDLQGGQDFMFSPTTGGLVWAARVLTSPP